MNAPSFPAEWWQNRPLIFGHRGANRLAPQNTLAAFRKAADVGADGVELDVQLSSDGVPVVIHDTTVNATTNGRGRVREMSLRQLQALDARAGFGAEFAGTRIPTLEEVFAELGDRLLFNIELKYPITPGLDLETAVLAVVRRMDMSARVWFSSFKPYALYHMRQIAPDIPCGLLYDFETLGNQLLSFFTPHEAIHPYVKFVTRRMVQHAHRHGQRLVAWTEDNLPHAYKLARWGVDVFISNDPGTLVKVLRGA